MLRNFLAVVKGAYLKRDPLLALLLFVFPLFLCLGILSLLSSETPRNLPVGVVAESGGDLPARLIRAIDATPTAKITQRCKSVSECASAMKRNEIFGFVYIPADLEKHALRYETPAVTVYTNGQSLLTSKLIVNDLRVAIATVGAILVKNSVAPPITTELHLIGNPSGNFERFLGIGLVVALFHVISMIVGAYIFSYPKRERQTKKWFVEEAKNSFVCAFFGRFLPAFFLLGLEFSLMLVLARNEMPALEMIDHVVLFGGAFCMIGVCLSYGAAIAGIVGEMRIALSSAAVTGGPAFAFCGQTFPIFAMPIPMRFFAFLLPITHFMKLQSAFFFGHAGIERAFHSFEILAAEFLFWLALGLLMQRFRIAKNLKQEELCSAS